MIGRQFALLLAIALLGQSAFGQILPPEKSWSITDSVMCDFATRYTFTSPWSGDSPHDALAQWIAKGNEKCGGTSGANYTVSYTLNTCTPNIIVSSNGTNPRAWAIANGCTYHRHAEPKPSCVGTCQPQDSDHAAPSPLKVCVSQGWGNGSQFTLTSPLTYGECMCPEGSVYADEVAMCLPTIPQTTKPEEDFCAANPIQPSTGNKQQTEVDYVGRGPAPLTFVRTYNSGAEFQKRWRTNYELSVNYVALGGAAVATLNRPEGNFAFQGSAPVADADVEYKLNGGNTYYTAISPDGRRLERYNSSNKLESVLNTGGTTLHTLIYSTSSTPAAIAPAVGLLIKVSNAFGQALDFTYDSQSRLKTMTDPAGGLYQYGYDGAGNLSSVTYPNGNIRQYLYNEPTHTDGANLPNALTGIIDEVGVRFATFSYNASGLAVATEHAGGVGRHEVTYTSVPQIASELVRDSGGVPRYVRRSYSGSSAAVVTDALGEAREYEFSSLHGRVRTTGSNKPSNGQCSAVPQSQTFDANGNVSSRTDFNGTTSTATYDLSRNIETSRTEAIGTASVRTITTQWDTSWRWPTFITTYAGATATGTPKYRLSLVYDSRGNVTTRTETDVPTSKSRTSTFTYSNYGQRLTENGPRTDVTDLTTYTYYTCTTGYQCGQVQTLTNAAGHVTTYNTYNAHGQPLTITDPNGVVTTLTYDVRQRLTSRTVGIETTSFEYWPTGLLMKATLPDGSYLEYTYDTAHRLTEIEDDEGNRIVYTLDAMGNRTAEDLYDPSNALTQTRTRVFNTLNRLWKEIGAAGTADVTTTFGHDNNGNQTAINAPLSRNTTQGYDELNRLTSVTDPASGVSQYGYNALDQLISVTDPRSKVTSYTYNALGDLTQQVSPDTGTTTNTYDSAGNLATSTDARNKTATYAYDALNRMTSVTYPDQTISYTYDTGTNQKGLLTQVSDASGSTSWSYDPHGRVLTRQQSMGITKTLGYSYDLSGRLEHLTLPSGNTITYGYSNGKVTSLTLNGSTTILSNVLYQPFGPTSGWTWGNSTLAVREYDTDGKVTDIDSAGLKTYSYDNAFRITGVTDATNPNRSQTYGYDLLDRLTSATGTGLNQSWTYDANGNRLTQGGSQSSTYAVSSANNRLGSISGALTRTYSYDAAGNTTGDGTVTFTYNDAGRMVSATKAGITTTYVLNALGQRVKKTTAGASTYFVYDEAGHLVGEYDNSANLIQETLWFGDTPVATLKPNGAGVNVYYVHTDHLNTPRRISRPSDNVVVWRWDSDPFGTSAANEDPDGDSNLFTYNLRFPGQYIDTETGLHYNYFRDYDPATGRYVQSDPIGLEGGINTYVYADLNPVTKYDPEGTSAIAAGAEGGAYVGGAIGGPAGAAIGGAIGAGIGAGITWWALRAWTCTASCNVQQIDSCVNCPERVTGTATGRSEEQACRAAKRVATQSTPRGCYPRHCRCVCSR